MAKRLTTYLETLSANAPVKLRLGTALARKVAAWMAVHGQTDLTYAIKDLISIGLAATPEDGVVYHGLTHKLAELKAEWLREAYRFTTLTSERLEHQIVAMGSKPGWLDEAFRTNVEAAERLKALRDKQTGG